MALHARGPVSRDGHQLGVGHDGCRSAGLVPAETGDGERHRDQTEPLGHREVATEEDDADHSRRGWERQFGDCRSGGW
jgi:hypothetical protein